MNISGSNTDVSVFERQQARIKWQQQQSFYNVNDHQLMGLVEIKPDPGLQYGWPDFSNGCQDQLIPPLMVDHNVKKRKTHEDQKQKVGSLFIFCEERLLGSVKISSFW